MLYEGLLSFTSYKHVIASDHRLAQRVTNVLYLLHFPHFYWFNLIISGFTQKLTFCPFIPLVSSGVNRVTLVLKAVVFNWDLEQSLLKYDQKNSVGVCESP